MYVCFSILINFNQVFRQGMFEIVSKKHLCLITILYITVDCKLNTTLKCIFKEGYKNFQIHKFLL